MAVIGLRRAWQPQNGRASDKASSAEAATVATVVVVDDDADTRRVVRLLLKRTRRFQIVGEAENGPEGIIKVRETQPHFVILDVHMPGMTGIQALPLIQAASPASKVMVFSGAFGAGTDLASLRGATFLEKEWDFSSLVPTLDAMARAGPVHVAPAPLPRA